MIFSKWNNLVGENILLAWGRKSSSFKVKQLARKNNKKFLTVEDGFLRSFGPGHNFAELSVVLDSKGCYYDASYPSDLENLLEFSTNLLSCQGLAFLHARSQIIANRLSKYNHTQHLDLKCFLQKSFKNVLNDESIHITKKILVLDQTFGDLSIQYGRADAKTFSDMLDSALAENSTATIYVKTHPEVTSGRKKGYLTHIQSSDRIVMIREDVNPIDLIQKMDKVYVVTSQMGFEALMCGKPVVCFGVPWYAGWGLTDDRVKDSPAWARRTKKRTLDELFAAAYIHYTRYLNPFTHQRGNIFDVIEWLILQKKMATCPFTRDFGVSAHKLPANA